MVTTITQVRHRTFETTAATMISGACGATGQSGPMAALESFRERSCSMRSLAAMLLTASLAVAFFLVSDSPVKAQIPQLRLDEHVVVTTRAPAIKARGTLGDHFLTFNAPVAVPGVALAPGTYLFRRPLQDNGNILQVTSVDRRHVFAMFFAVPAYRRDVTDHDRIVFGEPAVAGAPAPIKRWYLADETVGYELLYPKMSGATVTRMGD
jgi:hypothetical protein